MLSKRITSALLSFLVFSLVSLAAILTPSKSPLRIQVDPNSSNHGDLAITASGAVSNCQVTVQGGSWLQAGITDPSSCSLSYLVSAGALQVGTYNASLVISATGATTLTVPVILTVGAAQPPPAGSLTVDQSGLSFTATVGAQPASQQLLVTSDSTTSFTAAASVSGSSTTWLKVSPTASSTPGTITVSVDTTGLSANNYSGTVTLTPSSSAATPVTVSVNLTLTSSSGSGGGAFSVDHSSLSFSSKSGVTPATQTLKVSSDTAGVNFTAAATVNGTGPTWLKVSPTSGTTPASLTVSVDPTGLSVDTYTGTITITPATGTQVTVTVSYTVASAAALSADSSGLQFYYQIGSVTPTPQMFNVSGGSTATPVNFKVTVTMTEGTGWLTASTASGSTGTTPPQQQVTVSVAPTNLTSGTYHGKVTITDTASATNTVDVPVVLTIATGALLTVGTAPTPFTFQVGGATPAAQTVAIGSLGSMVTFNVTTTTNDGANWLSATPITGTTPQNLSISVNPGSLSPGSYAGTVIVTSTGANNSPLNIPVTLTVTSGTPTSAISASLQTVILNYQIGGIDEVLSQPIVVTSTGGPVAIAASSTAAASVCGSSWLQIVPSSFTTPGTAYVTLNPAGLSQPMTCLGAVVLSGAGSPIQIPVTANITTTPFLNILPQAVVFTAAYGSQSELSQSILLSTTDGKPATYAAVLATSSGGSWLSLAPSSGSTKSSISVTADPIQLPVGSYSGQIKITSPALQTPQIIPVTLNITATTSATVAPTSLSFSQTVGGTPPSAQTVNLGTATLGQSFSVKVTGGTLAASALSVTPLNGNTPSILSVSILPNTLAAGSYDASVVVTVPSAANSPITIPVNLKVGVIAPPALTVGATPSSLAFTYQQGAAAPASQQISVTSTGTPVNVSATAAASQGATWLVVAPPSGTTPASLTVGVDPTGLAPGSYTGTVTVTPAGTQSTPISVPVTLTVTSVPMSIASISNAASGVRGTISPGEIVTVTGSALGPATGVGLSLTADGKVSTAIGGTKVSFDEFAAPLLYTSTGQVNAIVPYEVAGRSTVQVVVENSGTKSDPYIMQVGVAAPGLFTVTQNGRGQAAILNEDNSYNGQATPAAKGSIVQVFGTGEGLTQPMGVTGGVTQALDLIAGKVTATVNGTPADVIFAGAAPQAVAGLFQVNVRIPASAPSGEDLIVITIAGASSQTGVTVAVK